MLAFIFIQQSASFTPERYLFDQIRHVNLVRPQLVVSFSKSDISFFLHSFISISGPMKKRTLSSYLFLRTRHWEVVAEGGVDAAGVVPARVAPYRECICPGKSEGKKK
jgi:hypothetical protein